MSRATVLMPCRDAARWLPEAIASLDAQTYQDFAVVAVDDGSTDDTRRVLEDWASRRRGVVVISQTAAGVAEALRAAVSVATGDVLIRMDADDIAEPERFQRQVTFLDAHPDVAACGTHVRYFGPRRITDGARRYESWLNSLRSTEDIHRDIFVECPLAHPTLAIRRDALQSAGGYIAGPWPEDYDLVLRLWAGGARLGVVPEVLLRWRDSATRASRTQARYSPDAFRACKVRHLLDTVLRDRPAVLFGTGPIGKQFARELHRQGGRVRAWFDLDPRKIGQTIYDTLVHHPRDISHFLDCVAIAAVGSVGARSDIRKLLHAAGRVDLHDFVAVA